MALDKIYEFHAPTLFPLDPQWESRECAALVWYSKIVAIRRSDKSQCIHLTQLRYTAKEAKNDFRERCREYCANGFDISSQSRILARELPNGA